MIQVEQHGPVTAIRMARALLGRPLVWTAAYWVDGLLIDSGPHCTGHELVRILQNVTVRQIVLTHAHEDHTGGVAALRVRFPQAVVYAAQRALPLLSDPALLHMQRYRRLLWGTPAPISDVVPLESVDNRVCTDSYGFRVIETPGHSREHISLFESTQRWLFSGDAFQSGRDKVWAPEFDLFGVMGSLRTLASLHPERIFPGSGQVRRTPLPELHEKIGYFIKLAREVALLDAAGMNEQAIADRLLLGQPAVQRWTFGHFTPINLVRACLDYQNLVAPFTPESAAPRTARNDPLSDSSSRQAPGHSDRVR